MMSPLPLSNVVRIISAGHRESLMPHTVAPHGGRVVVSDPESHRVRKWSRCKQNVQDFAGDGIPGNNDGFATKFRLFQPSGICRNSTMWYMFVTPKQAYRDRRAVFCFFHSRKAPDV